MTGLTVNQHLTHEQITRCPCCGCWEVVSVREQRRRAADPRPLGICVHLSPPERQREAS